MSDDFNHLPPELARVCRAADTIIMQRSAHFHTTEAWQELEAALAAARQYREWTPIDQIPEEWKDGRPVELFCPDDVPQVVVCLWIMLDEWEGWAFADEALQDIAPEGPRGPTHVRLLPPPPKEPKP